MTKQADLEGVDPGDRAMTQKEFNAWEKRMEAHIKASLDTLHGINAPAKVKAKRKPKFTTGLSPTTQKTQNYSRT